MSRGGIGYALALVVIGGALYAVDLHNPFILDDEYLILGNPSIQEITWAHAQSWFTENTYAGSGTLSDYYRPLLLVSFAATYSFAGANPFWYHFICNLLHVANGLLVFWLMLYGFKRHLFAFLTAVVFLIHPIQSEGVVMVAGQGLLLASFFMLLGLIAWLKGIRSGKRLFIYGIPSLLLLVALLSHESAIVTPFLAIVVYISFISRESFVRALKSACSSVLPQLALIVLYLALRLTVFNFRDFLNFGNYGIASPYYQEISVRFYTFMHVILEYVRMFLWPTTVHLRFTFAPHLSFFDWPVLIAFVGLLGLVAVLIVLYRYEHTSVRDERGSVFTSEVSSFRLWFFALGWFFVALVPASGIIPTNQIIQDHRLYLAMIGITVLCLAHGCDGIAYMNTRGFRIAHFCILGAFVFYLGFLSTSTLHRALMWGNPIALLEETLTYEPDALTAYNSLGKYYLQAGEYDKAKKSLLEAIRRGATSALPYYNLGLVYEIEPDPNIALARMYYQKALVLNPRYANAQEALARLSGE